jgi:alkanesulfonate monooxygenase SsuD/methylene tetrahydromethanopterin reductase-like flavin-dependent oxidoreductase (luciferase family)
MTSPGSLRVGMQLNTCQRPFRYEDIRRLAITSEEVGLDSIWTEDHLLQAYGDEVRAPWECTSVLAAMAEATTRVQLGTTVIATVFRNPALLAKQAITIDEISRGRLILGLGTGYNELELNAYGYPGDRLVSRFQEAFTIVRRLIRGERITFDGEFYEVRDCYVLPRGPRASGPELMVGTKGPRMLAMTLPYVDGWNGHWSWPRFRNLPEKFGEMSREIDQVCEDVGRDPAAVWRSGIVFVRLKGATGEGIYRLPPGIEALTGPASRLAVDLAAFAENGADHIQVFVDPPTEQSIEIIGEALAELRA